MNLPRRLILDQKVRCLVTTGIIYLYLFESVFLSPLSLALITLITCFVLNIRHINKYLRKVHAQISTFYVQIVHFRIQLQIIIYKELCLGLLN